MQGTRNVGLNWMAFFRPSNWINSDDEIRYATYLVWKNIGDRMEYNCEYDVCIHEIHFFWWFEKYALMQYQNSALYEEIMKMLTNGYVIL